MLRRSSRWNATSSRFSAEYSPTGMLTRPNVMLPFQIARAMTSSRQNPLIDKARCVPPRFCGIHLLMSTRASPNQVPARVWSFREGEVTEREDRLATEEPLEIRLRMGEKTWTVAVTMRTPGDDTELAAGFLYAEEVVADRERIRRIVPVIAPEESPGPEGSNIVE